MLVLEWNDLQFGHISAIALGLEIWGLAFHVGCATDCDINKWVLVDHHIWITNVVGL